MLAEKAGLRVPESRVVTLGSKHHTFLSKRFDRVFEGRIHFASAMTLLERSDGEDHTSGVSYLDLVEFIEQNGEEPSLDLMELWRRIVFSIVISNTDDHLRNHGFLLGTRGWRLSPAYDLNPNPYGDGLRLNISEHDNAQDVDLALEVSELFHLRKPTALTIVREVLEAVRDWRTVAKHLGATPHQIEHMQAAFRVQD